MDTRKDTEVICISSDDDDAKIQVNSQSSQKISSTTVEVTEQNLLISDVRIVLSRVDLNVLPGLEDKVQKEDSKHVDEYKSILNNSTKSIQIYESGADDEAEPPTIKKRKRKRLTSSPKSANPKIVKFSRTNRRQIFLSSESSSNEEKSRPKKQKLSKYIRDSASSEGTTKNDHEENRRILNNFKTVILNIAKKIDSHEESAIFETLTRDLSDVEIKGFQEFLRKCSDIEILKLSQTKSVHNPSQDDREFLIKKFIGDTLENMRVLRSKNIGLDTSNNSNSSLNIDSSSSISNSAKTRLQKSKSAQLEMLRNGCNRSFTKCDVVNLRLRKHKKFNYSLDDQSSESTDEEVKSRDISIKSTKTNKNLSKKSLNYPDSKREKTFIWDKLIHSDNSLEKDDEIIFVTKENIYGSTVKLERIKLPSSFPVHVYNLNGEWRIRQLDETNHENEIRTYECESELISELNDNIKNCSTSSNLEHSIFIKQEKCDIYNSKIINAYDPNEIITIDDDDDGKLDEETASVKDRLEPQASTIPNKNTITDFSSSNIKLNEDATAIEELTIKENVNALETSEVSIVQQNESRVDTTARKNYGKEEEINQAEILYEKLDKKHEKNNDLEVNIDEDQTENKSEISNTSKDMEFEFEDEAFRNAENPPEKNKNTLVENSSKIIETKNEENFQLIGDHLDKSKDKIMINNLGGLNDDKINHKTDSQELEKNFETGLRKATNEIVETDDCKRDIPESEITPEQYSSDVSSSKSLPSELTSLTNNFSISPIESRIDHQYTSTDNSTLNDKTKEAARPIISVRILAGDKLSITKKTEINASNCSAPKENDKTNKVSLQTTLNNYLNLNESKLDFPKRITNPEIALIEPNQTVTKQLQSSNMNTHYILKLTTQLRPYMSSFDFKRSDYIDNMLKQQSLVLLYKCMLFCCDYSTNIEADFSQHLDSHVRFGVSSFCCCYCTFITHDKDELIRHITETYKFCKYACSVCFYRTSIRYNLDKHVQIHKNANRVKFFVLKYVPEISEAQEYNNIQIMNFKKVTCPVPVCQFSGYTSHHFKEHFTYHGREFFCEKCKRIGTLDNVNHHLEICCSMYQYYCCYCEFKSNNLEDLSNHLVNRHMSKVPFYIERSDTSHLNEQSLIKAALVKKFAIARTYKTIDSFIVTNS